MASPLTILQGYNNAALQALSEGELSGAVSMAQLEVDAPAYGPMWAYQVADLAAHDLLSEIQADSGGSAGGGQTISEVTVGKRRVKYGSSGAVYQVDPRSDEGLQLTMYGRRFLRRRRQVSLSMLTTGMDL